MQTPKCLIENFSNEYLRIQNQERFKEEISQAIYSLMDFNDDKQADLARRLECSPARVSKMLSGSHNFTLEKLADVLMALGRAAHISLDSNTISASKARDEISKYANSNASLSHFDFINFTTDKPNTTAKNKCFDDNNMTVSNVTLNLASHSGINGVA